MFIDYKTNVWERFEIEDEHKESLLKFLKENPETSAMEIYDWYCENGGDPRCEAIQGTSVEMFPEENNGCSTLEIVSETLNGNETIYQNGAE
jgi:hypothetical protein